MHKVFILSTEEEFSLPHGSYLSDAAELELAGLAFGCKSGACGICAIEVVEGAENVSPQKDTERDFVASLGMPSTVRLACQCQLRGDIKINHR